MRAGLSRTLGLGLLVIGAVLAIAGAALPWYTASSGGRRWAGFSGTTITGGLAQALAVAILAGSLLMLALRVTGRRVVAVLTALIALVGLATLSWRRPDPAQVMTELRKHTLADSYQLTMTGGSLGYAAGCLLVLAGAVIVLLRAHRWPQRADRFERRAAAARTAVLTDDPDADIDTAAVWRSLDAGRDPTTGEEPAPPDRGRG